MRTRGRRDLAPAGAWAVATDSGGEAGLGRRTWSHAFGVIWGRKNSKAAHYLVAESYKLKPYFLQSMKNPHFSLETVIPNTGRLKKLTVLLGPFSLA